MTCEAGRPFFNLDHLIFSLGNIAQIPKLVQLQGLTPRTIFL